MSSLSGGKPVELVPSGPHGTSILRGGKPDEPSLGVQWDDDELLGDEWDDELFGNIGSEDNPSSNTHPAQTQRGGHCVFGLRQGSGRKVTPIIILKLFKSK